MKARILLVVAAVAFVAVACGSPTMPSPKTPSLAGAWTGTGVDSQGGAVITWTMIQTGANVSGTVQVRAPEPDEGTCNGCHRNKTGTLSGTIAGDLLTVNLHFPTGIDGDPTPICSATMNGSASTLLAGQLSGTYTGSDTCEGAFLDGKLAMTRK